MERPGYSLIHSRVCDVGIVWIRSEDEKAKVIRIFLSKDIDRIPRSIGNTFPDAEKARDKEISLLAGKIENFLEGKKPEFGFELAKTDIFSEFERLVLIAVRKIPNGKVATYKDIAKAIGARSARAIGSALAKNPFPIIVPCHRIVSSDGHIGGFQCGERLKRELLRLEGIEFDRKGRIREEFFVGSM